MRHLLLFLLMATPLMAQVPTQYAAMLTSADGGATWASPSGVVGGSPSYTPTVYAAALCQASAGAAWQLCNFGSGTGTISAIASSGSTITVTGGTGPSANVDLNLAHSNTWTAQQINSTAGALSTPAALFSGLAITTGGSGTTTQPLVLVQPATGAASTIWNTAGTYLGVNSPSGFTGNLIDLQANGVDVLKAAAGGTTTFLAANAGSYQTSTVCANAASPAVCAAASAGSVAVPAAGTTLQVNSSRVTANSQILLTFDSSLGTRLSVTCNTTPNQPTVSARTAGSSFTITMASALSVNPDCISYTIIN